MNGSGEIVRQSPTDISNLHCDLDLVHCNPLLSQETPVYDHTPSPTFGYKWMACLEDRVETVMFSLHINSCCDLDLEESEPIFSQDIPTIIHLHTKLGSKGQAVQAILSGQHPDTYRVISIYHPASPPPLTLGGEGGGIMIIIVPIKT